MDPSTDAYAGRLAVAWRLRRRGDRTAATLEQTDARHTTVAVYRNQRELLRMDTSSRLAVDMSRAFRHLLVSTGWRDDEGETG